MIEMGKFEMMRVLKWAFSAAILLFAALLLVGPAPVEQGHATTAFDEVGYLKLGNNARLFTIRYEAAGNAAVHAHAKGLMYTSGRVTAAYYYPKGARVPADGITLSGSWDRAQAVLWENPGVDAWDFVFWRYPNGESKFVDCRSDSSDLCRK
jgi:hypothetical protein